jgi:hypothetical protein
MSTALQTIVADMWKASRAEVYSPKGFLGKGFRSEEFRRRGQGMNHDDSRRNTKESAEASSLVRDGPSVTFNAA